MFLLDTNVVSELLRTSPMLRSRDGLTATGKQTCTFQQSARRNFVTALPCCQPAGERRGLPWPWMRFCKRISRAGFSRSTAALRKNMRTWRRHAVLPVTLRHRRMFLLFECHFLDNMVQFLSNSFSGNSFSDLGTESGKKMVPPYDSRKVANQFIRFAKNRGKPMTILRVLKLAYMAHGWHLALTNEPLVNEPVQAWRHGPVIPSIYYAFRPQGIIIGLFPFVKEDELDQDTKGFLSHIDEMYQGLSANRLSALTHIKGGPWDMTYRAGELGTVIPNNLIKEHFISKLERAKEAKEAKEEGPQWAQVG